MKELVRGLTERRTQEGVCVLRCHYSADEERDPARNPQWKEAERKKYTSQGAWDREQEIIHSAGGGERIFAEVLSRWGHKIFIDPAKTGFQPSPHWNRIGGFDHGKANPTAALAGCIDYDGTIWLLGEYYQPGLSPREHAPSLLRLRGFTDSTAYADPSIFYKTQAQSDGTFKAIASMYEDYGIANLVSAPENSELLGMERILAHWTGLEDREPTLKIVCPAHLQDIQRPIYGVHNEGCPNLIWELKRARRQELTAAQLASRNPSEKMVDKDEHLRDCLKYLCLALPESTAKTTEQLIAERIGAQNLDPTSAMIRAGQYRAELEYQGRPIRIGRGRFGRS